MNSNMQMIQKGTISVLKGPADRNGDPTTAQVLPATADGLVTRPITIPWWLRGEMGKLKPGVEVAYAKFEDDTGVILSRMDGNWDGIVPGNVTVIIGDVVVRDRNVKVPSGDVAASGISLTRHTHDGTGGPH